MRTAHAVVPAALLALLLTGCSGTSDEPAEEAADSPAGAAEAVQAEEPEEGLAETGAEGAEEEVTEWVFAAGDQITVELTLYSEADGGRSTPVYSGYRPSVEFDHLGQSVACSVQLPADVSPFEPGETHLVGLECAEEVTVHVDDPGFVLIEGGKENGEGEAVFTDM
ncbi:hypothetical protein [Nocardiopsis metallicus]|uniref:Lipoprotein n=1 Tax=Nocardiopsis metallicus TaxID=179819 RepID=A0A840WCL8_9ACTN|nr:hypothetical protein [Nocardiopsis metallicus]MBB5493143.1 hypothetical protein [Nocardiopsis metallicus]